MVDHRRRESGYSGQKSQRKKEQVELFAVLLFGGEQVSLKEMPIRCLSNP